MKIKRNKLLWYSVSRDPAHNSNLPADIRRHNRSSSEPTETGSGGIKLVWTEQALPRRDRPRETAQ
jgi:hypothetical protein